MSKPVRHPNPAWVNARIAVGYFRFAAGRLATAAAPKILGSDRLAS